jgi:hypothetical protein
MALAWTYRVSFDLRRNNADSYTVNGRIYVNWVAVWTEQWVNSTTYSTFVESITVTAWQNIQLYLKDNNSTAWRSAEARNFRIFCAMKPRIATSTVVL